MLRDERQSARMSKITNDGLVWHRMLYYPYGNSGRQRVIKAWIYSWSIDSP